VQGTGEEAVFLQWVMESEALKFSCVWWRSVRSRRKPWGSGTQIVSSPDPQLLVHRQHFDTDSWT